MRDDGGERRLEIVRGGREEVLFETRCLFACPDARGVVDERAALQDDRGLVGDEASELDVTDGEDRRTLRAEREDAKPKPEKQYSHYLLT